jgi:predicted nuclease of predicted toxin-antitoxin system
MAARVVRSSDPRVYVDANIPTGVVGYMRVRLGWDVFFVLEHDDLRRARDTEHYRLARQLGRTLMTLDHDYEDDRRFPPGEGAGVIVFSAPDEERLRRLLRRADRELFRAEGAVALPLEGRKMRWDPAGPDDMDEDDAAGTERERLKATRRGAASDKASAPRAGDPADQQ